MFKNIEQGLDSNIYEPNLWGYEVLQRGGVPRDKDMYAEAAVKRHWRLRKLRSFAMLDMF